MEKMKDFYNDPEATKHGQSEAPAPEESGVRRIVKSDETEMFQKMRAKAEEVHPDDPWEKFGPKDEEDVAKVWGVEDTDALDKEDSVADRALRKRIEGWDKDNPSPKEERKAV